MSPTTNSRSPPGRRSASYQSPATREPGLAGRQRTAMLTPAAAIRRTPEGMRVSGRRPPPPAATAAPCPALPVTRRDISCTLPPRRKLPGHYRIGISERDLCPGTTIKRRFLTHTYRECNCICTSGRTGPDGPAIAAATCRFALPRGLARLVASARQAPLAGKGLMTFLARAAAFLPPSPLSSVSIRRAQQVRRAEVFIAVLLGGLGEAPCDRLDERQVEVALFRGAARQAGVLGRQREPEVRREVAPGHLLALDPQVRQVEGAAVDRLEEQAGIQVEALGEGDGLSGGLDHRQHPAVGDQLEPG